MFELLFLSLRDGKLIMLQAIPELGDERETLRWRQPAYFVGREHFHAFQPTGKAPFGQWSWAPTRLANAGRKGSD